MDDQTITIKNISKDLVKQTFKMLLAFIFVIALFLVFNILFVIFKNIDHLGNISYLRLIVQILIGLIFVFLSFWFVRSYIFINTISVVYKYLTPFFKKLTSVIIENVYSKSLNLSKTKHVGKVLDIGEILKNSYNNKVPRIVQRGIIFLINLIPFADFILIIQKEMKPNEGESFNNELMSEKLYEQTDRYIQDSIFGDNNLSWLLWLFPLNVVIQFLVYYLMKS